MKNIKRLREESGLSYREIQKYTGIGFSYLCKLEKNQLKLTPAIIKKLSKFYSVDSCMITDSPDYCIYIIFEGDEVPLSNFEYDKYGHYLSTIIVNQKVKRVLKEDADHEFVNYLLYRKKINLTVENDLKILASLNKLTIDGLLKAQGIIKKLLGGT